MEKSSYSPKPTSDVAKDNKNEKTPCRANPRTMKNCARIQTITGLQQ